MIALLLVGLPVSGLVLAFVMVFRSVDFIGGWLIAALTIAITPVLLKMSGYHSSGTPRPSESDTGGPPAPDAGASPPEKPKPAGGIET